ncbi:hypothetical protein BH11PSE2_BH11PSE2_09810 [soil metagenome]
MALLMDSTAKAKAYHVGNVRSMLLGAARAALREGGVSNVKLRSMSTQEGVALGSVSHHFASKADLLAAVAVEGFGELKVRIETAGASGVLVVRACVAAYFDFAWHEPNLYSLMFEAKVARAPLVRAARDRAFAAMEAAFSATPLGRTYPAETVHDVSVAVWTCAHGAASLAPIQEEGDHLAEAMIRGLEELFQFRRENQSYPNTVQNS